jgi:polyisoprenoid-binding protein YceI
MLLSKVRYWLILIPVLTALLAACAPVQTQAPAATSAPVQTQAPAATNAPSQTPAPATTGTQAPTVEATAPDSTAPTSGSTGSGTKYVLVSSKSEASFSVREQLANRDLPNDAIGKTNAVSGQVVVNPDGSIDQANSKFVVDATTLQTDSSMRDGYVRRNILQVSQYPQIVFVPTGVSGLPSPLPQSGDVSFKVTGDLTIRDVTKPVTWDVTGTINNDEATGTATTSFTFEDFNLSQPKVPVVLSVVDKITLTVNVALQQ